MLRTELPQASRVVMPASAEVAHRGLDVVQLDEVELDVLPRGDVPEAARVALGDVGQRRRICSAASDPLRNLDAQHLRVAGLPLTVGAAHEPEGAPLVGRDLAALEPLEQSRRTRRCPPRSRTTAARARTSRDPAGAITVLRQRPRRPPPRARSAAPSLTTSPITIVAGARSQARCALLTTRAVAPPFGRVSGATPAFVKRRAAGAAAEISQGHRPHARRGGRRSRYDRRRRHRVPAACR